MLYMYFFTLQFVRNDKINMWNQIINMFKATWQLKIELIY